MADPKPGSFRFSSRDAKAIMASRKVQSELEKAAKRGVAAFKAEANKRRKSGKLADRVRVEKAQGWDGRPGVRIVATSKGNQSALFGTRRSRPVRAQEAAIRAINGGRKGR
ncbi:hypothetical protein ABH922_002793 [Rhodococcus sp. 27YEA15]|uniref:hypothetical protein n=1 Tax=Rhodococcus sp. 27YEA15 TaxID=3156259 RepID=UPI003C7DDAF8